MLSNGVEWLYVFLMANITEKVHKQINDMRENSEWKNAHKSLMHPVPLGYSALPLVFFLHCGTIPAIVA